MSPLTSSTSANTTARARSTSAMPSDANNKPASRLLSKVNSFTRNWEDDAENKFEPEFTIVEKKEPVAMASVPVVAEASTTAAVDDKELARQRRRAAIMAALNSNPGETSTSAAGGTAMYNADGSRRSMPWEQSLESTKRAAAEKADKPAAKKSALNIKQKVILSSEQQRVLSLVVQDGKSLFFTGSAGTGKSVLLREIISSLRRKYSGTPDAVAVTASTGIAACNIGGITLHSFSGFGLGLEEPRVLVGKVRRNKKSIARWTRTKVLIIDEVSMVDGDFFDKLAKIGSMVRKGKNAEKPFGGMQVIVTGDFFQLPPVTKGGASPRFAFEAETWAETMSMSVNLTKVFRQSDQTFVDMLNEMRFGRLTPASIDRFKRLSRTIRYDDGIEPTELFPMRDQVERANRIRMDALNTEGWTYDSTDSFGPGVDPQSGQKVLENFMATKSIHVKINAQVMLIKNLDETLVNGSMGKVIGFCHRNKWPVDGSDWTPEGTTDFGPEGESETSLLMKKHANPNRAPDKPHPVVRFKTPNGHRTELVVGAEFKTESPTGDMQALRLQLPLIPAWAMSIHKSQGQTLERVKVDLRTVFEMGQAYVALSRATSLDGLQLLNFRPQTVKAHPKVTQWSTTLQSV